MEDQAKPGTFIPRDTVVSSTRRDGGSNGLNDLLLLFGFVIVVASGALAVAVFLYGQFLQSESVAKLQQLQTAEAAFQPSLIEQVTQLDDRMHAASDILSAHIAPTEFLDALNQTTLQTVSFQSLDFEAPDAQHMSLKMQGVAQSVNSIAYESDLLSKSSIIVSPIFSNIARQPDGVHFDLTATVNPTALGYESLVAGAQSAQTAAAPTQPASPFGNAPQAQQQTQPTAQTTQAPTQAASAGTQSATTTQ